MNELNAFDTVHAPRYRSLDMLRGAASIAVMLLHLLSQRGMLLHWLNLGVQAFFVISGYCLAAAADKAHQQRIGLGAFMRRRVRRIAPPYLASACFALLCIAIKQVSTGGWQTLSAGFQVPVRYYIANATMTQWLDLTWHYLVGDVRVLPWGSAAVNFLSPTYWSLNYEEQFYLLMGVVALARTRSLLWSTLGSITLAVLTLNVVLKDEFSGLFFDYWLQFACGIYVYYRLCVPKTRATNRTLDTLAALAVLAVGTIAFGRGELAIDCNKRQFYGQLLICLSVAGLLIVLRKHDARLSGARLLKPMTWFGSFSYSLYLIHFPLLRAATRIHAQRPNDGYEFLWNLAVAVAIILVAYAFSVVFERPFMSAEYRLTPGVAPEARVHEEARLALEP